MAEFISQRGRRRKRRARVWAAVHGALAFAVALPVLLLAAWLNGDLPSAPVQLRTLTVRELPNTHSAIEAAVRPIAARPARRRTGVSETPAPLLPAPDFDVLAPAELEAISQAR